MNTHETIKIFDGEQEILKLPIKGKKINSLEMSKLVRQLVVDELIDSSKFCFLNFSFLLETEKFIFSQIEANTGFQSLLYHLLVPQFIDLDFETKNSDFQIVDFNGESISPLSENLRKRHRYGFRSHALRKYIFHKDDSLIKEGYKKEIENASIELIKKYFLTERFKSLYFSNFYFENEKVFDLGSEDDFFLSLKKNDD